MLNHFHLLPVVGKFLAAIEAGYVRAGEGSSMGVPLPGPAGHWKAEALVCAAKQNIEQIRHIHHLPNSGPRKLDRLGAVLSTLTVLYHGTCTSVHQKFIAHGTQH